MASVGTIGIIGCTKNNDDTNKSTLKTILEVQAIMTTNDREQLNLDTLIEKIADELKYTEDQRSNLDHTELAKFGLLDNDTKTRIVIESTSESIKSKIENSMKEVAEQLKADRNDRSSLIRPSLNNKSNATKKKYKKKYKKKHKRY